MGWEAKTVDTQLDFLLAESGLRVSDLPPEGQKRLAEHYKILLSNGKIMNLEQEEFANIVEDRNGSLETIENPCTAEELIELLAGASSQTRWIVACGVVEICCYDGATMDKIIDARGKQINIFWSRISAYSNPITKADRDEMVGVLKRLPPVLFVHIGGCLYNFVVETNIDKKASAVMKKNSEMITTIFVDPDLAKAMLGM